MIIIRMDLSFWNVVVRIDKRVREVETSGRLKPRGKNVLLFLSKHDLDLKGE